MQDNVYRIEHLNKSYENSNGDRIQVTEDRIGKVYCSSGTKWLWEKYIAECSGRF